VEEVGAFDVSVIRIARNNSARGAESAAAFFTVPFCYLRVPMRARARAREYPLRISQLFQAR